MGKVYVRDIAKALDDLSNGRCMNATKGNFDGNPFVVTKSSGIPGKAVTETPGLVFGDPDMEVKKIAVMMTMTESAIELAAGCGVNVMITHHPVADASNSGGVLIKTYLGLYKIAVFEFHEAFHGLHPGIPWLHGHTPSFASISYGGISGNVVYIGETLPEINTAGDIIRRLDKMMDLDTEAKVLQSIREHRGCDAIEETSLTVRGKIMIGDENSSVQKLIHIFPHTGILPQHIRELVAANPGVDTILATISRVYEGDPLLDVAKELGLNFICGNSHAMEIYENGIPLAAAIRDHLPDAPVVIFRENVTCIPLESIGTQEIRNYGDEMSATYLRRRT